MLYSPFVPVVNDFQNVLPKPLQECFVLGIVSDDTLSTARKPIGRIVESIEMDLAVKITFRHTRRRYPLQDIPFTQAPVDEEVDAHALFRGHDLQVPGLFYRRDETFDS